MECPTQKKEKKKHNNNNNNNQNQIKNIDRQQLKKNCQF